MLTAAGAGKQLGILLTSLATREDIKRILNLDEGKPEGFWESQEKTVKNRFYSYVLHELGLPLTLDRKELTTEQAAMLFTRAYRLLDKGLTYEEVRNWWLNQGMYLHASQFYAKREAEQLAKTCVRVLVFMPEGGAKFLAFDEQQQPLLVSDATAAFQLPVYSSTQLASQKLLDDAEHFRGLVGQLGAKSVKLLVGQRV